MGWGWAARLNYQCYSKSRARTTRKPEDVDEYLKTLVDVFFTNRDSIVQRIEHSVIWRNSFEGYMQDIDNRVGHVRNVRAAKHRHESYAKPRGRFVLYMDAFITVAEHMSADRSGAEREGANRFLMFLNEESAMAAAMLADAADEGLLFTRILDNEDTDAAELQDIVGRFIRRLELLFVEGGCMKLPGYTEFMASSLKRVRVLRLPGGRTKSFGGPAAPSIETVQSCLMRMQSYTKLAVAARIAEFPSHDLCSAFRIFDLMKGKSVGSSQGMAGPLPDQLPELGRLAPAGPGKPISSLSWVLPDGLAEPIKRLTKFFKVDRGLFVTQFTEHRIIAHHFAAHGASTVDAWHAAVRKTQAAAHRPGRRHADEQLIVILQR